jgi:hypothetical protein
MVADAVHGGRANLHAVDAHGTHVARGHAAIVSGGAVSRCRRNHDKVGELPGKLDGHGTDPASATYDKDGVARAWYRPADIKAIKERLPGSNRRKRDSG